MQRFSQPVPSPKRGGWELAEPRSLSSEKSRSGRSPLKGFKKPKSPCNSLTKLAGVFCPVGAEAPNSNPAPTNPVASSPAWFLWRNRGTGVCVCETRRGVICPRDPFLGILRHREGWRRSVKPEFSPRDRHGRDQDVERFRRHPDTVCGQSKRYHHFGYRRDRENKFQTSFQSRLYARS